jgi:hypothetical protein
MYKHSTLWGNIKYLPHAIKYRFQRAFRGWADCDTWDMDFWFIEVMKPMLQHLRDTHMGHPGDLTEEAWNVVLDRMIFLLAEMDENTCSQQNTFWRSGNKDKALAREIDVCKYRDTCKDEFFRLFSKYFYNLWD